MRASFLLVGDIRTHVGCWGRWVEEADTEEVIICIPGNPGLPGFYYEYLNVLFQTTNLPVWIIGHAGHEEPSLTYSSLSPIGEITGRESAFNLRGQLAHKVDFIKMYTTPKTKIHLVGHSIGAWMAMEMFKDSEISGRIASANLLFPTLQKMAKTPNGFWVDRVYRTFQSLIIFIVYLFSMLPYVIKKYFLFLIFFFYGIPAIFLNTVIKYACPSVIAKVLFMAFDEMDLVTDLDIDNLRANKDNIKIVYSCADKWAPEYLFTDLHKVLPDLKIERVPYAHAFIFKSSSEVASITARFITEGH